MKRICFDISCNYFHNSLSHRFVNNPSQARDYFEERYQECRLYAATTFDSHSKTFKDFIDHKKLFAYLSTADEIITFNGRVYYLIALEALVGKEAMRSIWRKPHHDLAGWQESSLKGSVSKCLPNIAASFEAVKSDRLAEILNSFDEDTAKGLASTYRDTKFTFALFQQYLVSRDSKYTFHDA